MMTPGIFDSIYAKLLREWLSTARWSEPLFDLIKDFLENTQTDFRFKASFSGEGDTAETQKTELLAKLVEIDICDSENPAFAALSERFSLSHSESSLLRFFFLYSTYGLLESYMDALPEWEAVRRLARYCATDEQRMVQLLGPRSTLLLSGLGSTEGRALRLKRIGIEFGLTNQILSFISTGGSQPLVSFLLETPAAPTLPLSAYNLDSRTLTASRITLGSPHGKPFVLIYGKPGTGKSEFARSLSVSCGYAPCFLRHDRETGSRSYSNLLLAARLVDPKKEVLVVDEADELLNLKPSIFGGGGDIIGIRKSMINDFLDDIGIRLILITNETCGIPDSILRRFSFHIGFEDFTLAQRTRVWNTLDAQTGIFSDNDRNLLATRYRANPSRIKQVLDICASLGEVERTKEGSVLSIAGEILGRGDELLYGTPRRDRPITGIYDPAFLNLDMPGSELMVSLENWKKSFVQEEQGINILFYGESGTGKTAFAHHLAERLGFQAIVKRASDLLSPWVGGTEKNIREAFREAEGAVLIFDEADSLIAARKDAKAGWERTKTNEVLVSMEDFKGLFIASTNFKNIIDRASLRRFTFKVEFKPTAPAQRKQLVQLYFPGVHFTDTYWADLEGLDSLTPGDVSTVANRLRYSSIRDGGKIMAALREETSSRGPRQSRIGFGT